ncbi:molybdopterin dinucleotide binding domain-containing protein [Engelhardtia mirabilis]|uniref:Polysulfide reductase chain A n=1 Tax=Engelhardtia mirabilis TaxID=2528011 RepID=A0A518BEJ4_9BACT|nr:Polysulfide reductase chain A precursor [Planctomycetes bacterium Pla133]QDU99726.1 Polysulfide reductase chain A precursor [Planctomycetes bacterium Pla86]
MSDSTHPHARTSPWDLAVGPPPDQWDDWVELDPKAWPERVEKHYRCVPTICFNCESACGLLAFVDKGTGETVKFEGNPAHPGSRGRTCAKGPATINQVQDPERILKPMKRVGPRGGGQWEETTWEEALDDIGGRIRKAFDEDRHNEVSYHVGRPGEDHFVLRMLEAWGIDGHNSHTNVCSASARLGYSLWFGADRPSPDHGGAEFILLLSAHLETGHYFNPHAQRIIEAKERGTEIAVVDTRLSNTSTHADRWISPWPGSEAAMLLAVARLLLESDRVDHAFVRRWTNWQAYLEANDEGGPGTYERFIEKLKDLYAHYTPQYAVKECSILPGTVEYLADQIAKAGSHFASHLWRNTAAGNLGGWQVARALMLLHVLSGSVGTKGGLNPNSWDKAHPHPSEMPPPITRWNERHWPKEWPLAHYEMSFLLPHLLREQDSKIDVYFTRVYNPVWTNPDGCSWVEMFEEEGRIGCHVALTPTWNETAQWADYVLPMGLGPERHDLMSQETHAGTWIGFRQPVGREYARLEGRESDTTRGTNPGEVWEESEFWIALTWRIDPDGSLGIRKYFESKQNPGRPIGMDEYWSDVFAGVPGLPDAAAAEDTTPLGYMKRYGAFAVPYAGQERYATKVDKGGLELEDGSRAAGFPTQSKRLEFYSSTMREWGFPDGEVPTYQRSQVHWSQMDLEAGERALLPTFRLPTLIHTRSANSKWLQEISHTNPLWVHPEDARAFGVETGDLIRVNTRIGYFVPRVWVTEGIHPGIVACSHHVGRWRLHDGIGNSMATATVDLTKPRAGAFLFRQKKQVGPFASRDSDTSKVHWHEAGVNQNLTFPVQPDPASGMHCWHQKVRLEVANAGDRYGDVFVDTAKSRAVYEEWKGMCVPAPGPGGLRRPLHMKRPLKPVDEAYKL